MSTKNIGIKGINGLPLVDEEARRLLANANIVNPFDGKNWAVFGDSISQPNTDGVDKYYNYISDDLGITVTSYAVGGSGYFKGSGSTGWGDNNIPNQIETASSDFDIISMMAGVNERGIELGTITDEVVDTPTTLCGAFKKSLEMAIEKYPLATIFVITSTSGTSGYNALDGEALNNYVNAQIEICKMYNIPCLDLFHCGGLRPWNSDFFAKYYKDYVHLLTEGHEFISKPIMAFMNTLSVN